MKLNKLFLGLLGVAAMAFTACSSDDDKYEWAQVSGSQVYFSLDMPEIQEISKAASSFSVPLYRQDSTQAITVSLTSEKPANSVFTIPTSVSFEAGQNVAQINVTYNPDDVVYGNYEALTIALADSTIGTPYGAQSYTFSAGVTAWVSMGTAKYRDDMMNRFWNTGTPEYDVEVEKSIIEEGMYRLVYPYGEAYPYNDPGDWDASQTYYLTINATDPDFVWVENSPQGIDWNYGMISMRSYVEYFLANGNSMDVIKANRPDLFGKLENGVITMPTGSMLISMTNYNDGGWYISASNGAFRVLLPGAVLADYSAEVQALGVFTDLTGTVFASGELSLGADATIAKAVVVPVDADVEAVADAIAAGELEATDVEAGQIYVPIEEGVSGELVIVVAVLDANGNVKTVANSNTFAYYGGGANPWKSLGIGYLTDNFVITQYYANRETETVYEPQTFEVEILENEDTPGLYRLVDAYKGVADLIGLEYESTNLEVNATNPEGVYVSQQFTGLVDDGDEISIVTNGARYLANYSVEELIGYGYLGKNENGVITFPHFPYRNEETKEVQFTYQGIIFFGTSGYYSATDGDFKIVLPGASAESRSAAQSKAKAAKFQRNLNAFAGLHKVNAKQLKKQEAKALMHKTAEAAAQVSLK